MCYIVGMDTTIRNLDEQTYRRLKAQAALEGKTIGEAVTEAMQVYLAQRFEVAKDRTLGGLEPEAYPPPEEGSRRPKRTMERVVHKASSHEEAERWNVAQQKSMTPEERLRAARVLRDRAYPPDAKDVRECHRSE